MKRWVCVLVLLCVAVLSFSAQAQPVKKTTWPDAPFCGIPMVCDYPTHFALATNGVLTLSKPIFLWTKDPIYDLSKGEVVIRANVKLSLGAEYELLFADSVNNEWAVNLYFRIGCGKDDVWGATYVSMGGGEPDKRIKESDYLLLPDKWQNVVVKLSKKNLIAYVDGTEVINAGLSGVKFPQWGHIGLLGCRDAPCQVSDFNISQQ